MNNLLSTIPKKNIDFGKNYIEVLDNVFTGKKATLRVDKLSFTTESGDKNEMIIKLSNLKSTSKYVVKHYSSGKNIVKHYERTILIYLRKNKKIALFINYKPRNKGVSFIRFDLSPQHIKSKQISYLFNFLIREKCLGEMFFTLLKNAKVTRIDIALDLYGISASNYYFGLKRATKGKLNHKEECHGFGGVCLGSYHSALQISVYDKIHINKDNINKIEHYLYFHEELKFMRIEARIKPKGNNKLKLSDLLMGSKLSNPFKLLSIYPLCIKRHLLKYKLFYNMLDDMTIPEALVKIEKGYTKECIRKILKQNSICLFDSDELWKAEKIKCMALLGVLQQPAYWNKIDWRKHIFRIKYKGK